MWNGNETKLAPKCMWYDNTQWRTTKRRATTLNTLHTQTNHTPFANVPSRNEHLFHLCFEAKERSTNGGGYMMEVTNVILYALWHTNYLYTLEFFGKNIMLCCFSLTYIYGRVWIVQQELLLLLPEWFLLFCRIELHTQVFETEWGSWCWLGVVFVSNILCKCNRQLKWSLWWHVVTEVPPGGWVWY